MTNNIGFTLIVSDRSKYGQIKTIPENQWKQVKDFNYFLFFSCKKVLISDEEEVIQVLLQLIKNEER